jgi:NAD+-processing family protein with receiver domain
MSRSGPSRYTSQWQRSYVGGPQYRVIGADEKVLVVEDALSRVMQFKKWIPDAKLAATASSAIAAIQRERFDWIMLDRDLIGPSYGEDVCVFLVSSKFAGRVVIHSANDFGAQFMHKILTDGNVRVERIPFSLLGLLRERRQ